MLRSSALKSALGETLSAGTVFAFVFSSPSGALVAYAGLDIIENATVKMAAIVAACNEHPDKDVMVDYQMWHLYVSSGVDGLHLGMAAEPDTPPGLLRLKLKTLQTYLREQLLHSSFVLPESSSILSSAK
ncbi:MAG: hypothetical protein SGCHY_000122 [Lobulomycetales sp.]